MRARISFIVDPPSDDGHQDVVGPFGVVSLCRGVGMNQRHKGEQLRVGLDGDEAALAVTIVAIEAAGVGSRLAGFGE